MFRHIFRWDSAPYPGSVACGGPIAPRRSLAYGTVRGGVVRLRSHKPGTSRTTVPTLPQRRTLDHSAQVLDGFLRSHEQVARVAAVHEHVGVNRPRLVQVETEAGQIL